MLDPVTLSEAIRNKRKDLGLSQQELAQRAGCGTHTLLRIENGYCASASFGTICNICNVLGISLYFDFMLQTQAAEPSPTHAQLVDQLMDSLTPSKVD